MAHGGSTKAVFYALGANSGIAVEARVQERFAAARWVFFEPNER